MERRASPPGKRATRPSPRERLAIDGSRHASGDDNRRRISHCWAGRLEIIFAVAYLITRTAGQLAASTVARLEFDVIGARGDWANADGEGSIAVNVGRDNAEFDRHCCSGHALPCERYAGTAVVNRKLAEGRGKRGAEGHDSDLIKLAGRSTHQGKGHRQSVRRRIHRPTDLASCVVKRFGEVVPPPRSTSEWLPSPKPCWLR